MRGRWVVRIRRRLLPLLVAVLVAALTLYGTLDVYRKQLAVLHHQERFAVLNMLSDVADELAYEINETIRYSDFLSLIVSRQPEISEQELVAYAALAIEQSPFIAGIQFAPEGVVRIVYPHERHKAAIGHDLLQDLARRKYAVQAIKQRKAVLQGPVKALQGGYFMFNRKGIFFERDGEEQFWGLSVVAMDFDHLMSRFQARFHDDSHLFALRLWTEQESADLWGDGEVFTAGAISRMIDLPHARWELAALPRQGWRYTRLRLADVGIFHYVFTVLAFVLTYLSVASYRDKLDKSRHEPLTGTLNKAALQQQAERLLKRRARFALLLMDLNGFKQINDSLGHYVGDCVLIEVSRRIREVLRAGDVLSRFGGDEFIALLDCERSDVAGIVARIVEQVGQPMQVDGHELEVGVSIGHAFHPDQGSDYDSLYQYADGQMYEHKKALKNQ